MAARVIIKGRHLATYDENPDGARHPVWDKTADGDRHYTASTFKYEDMVLDAIRDHGPITQYALWRMLREAGHDDVGERRLSAALLTLRKAGEIKSERDATARKSPRARVFMSPVWELA